MFNYPHGFKPAYQDDIGLFNWLNAEIKKNEAIKRKSIKQANAKNKTPDRLLLIIQVTNSQC